MAPAGLAILLGAGPNTGTGIARILATQGNLAVALLARRQESLNSVKSKLQSEDSKSTIETFVADAADPNSITKAFSDIKSHPNFKGLKLRAAVYSVKHSAKKPFLEETYPEFTKAFTDYVGGAMIFSQESIKRMLADNPGAEGANPKKGTIIFTGTLGAMRTNAQFASYGASRASVRMLAQGLAKEFSNQGIQVVHTIMNGKIADEEGEEYTSGKSMSANTVGKEYLKLIEQEPSVWTHELDMRPALEKF